MPISPKIILDEKVKFVTFIFLPLSTHLSKIFCVNMRSMQKVLAAYWSVVIDGDPEKKHLYGGLNCKAELATIFHETLFLLERTIDKQIIVIHTWVLERHFPEK